MLGGLDEVDDELLDAAMLIVVIYVDDVDVIDKVKIECTTVEQDDEVDDDGVKLDTLVQVGGNDDADLIVV